MTNRKETLQNLLTVAGLALIAAIWWDTFKVFVVFAVTLGILVTIHEWGHFIAAKSVGVRVYEFALGFGPKLMTYMRRGGTEYTIRALPLGGFVNPKGMQPDDPITADGINGRRPAERALVYLAGPLMNVILGFGVLLFLGATVGMPDESLVLVGEISKHSAAQKMPVVSVDGKPAVGVKPGLRVGDRILEVNGERIDGAESLITRIHPRAEQKVTLKVARQGHELVLTGTPQWRKYEGKEMLTVVSVPPGTALDLRSGDIIAQVDGRLVGANAEAVTALEKHLREKQGKPVRLVVWRGPRKPVEVTGTAGPVTVAVRPGERYFGALGFGPIPGQGPPVSVGESVDLGARQIQNIFGGYVHLFSRPKEMGDKVGGVITIWATLSQVGNLPPFYYFHILGQLSISLAVFNLLPIFLLDGGHMLMLTMEVLRRRRLEPEMHRVAAVVGLAIIGVLFVFIMYKDIMRHVL